MLLLCSVAPQYPNSGLPPPKELLLSVLAFKPQALDLGVNPSTLPDDDFFPLIEARHLDSFKLLGIREFQGSQFGRVFRPDAVEVAIVDTADDARRFPLTRSIRTVCLSRCCAELSIRSTTCLK